MAAFSSPLGAPELASRLELQDAAGMARTALKAARAALQPLLPTIATFFLDVSKWVGFPSMMRIYHGP